jgi:hypothetical protein
MRRDREDAMRVMFASVIATLLLAGCATPPAEDGQAAAGKMVGQSETDLVRQMGIPTRAFETDGHRFLAYLERHVDITPATGPWAPFWGWWGAGSYGPDTAPMVVDFVCETTFEVAGGKVQSFQRRGNACG